MAQCYIQYCQSHHKRDRVLSLILCNAFADTSYFVNNAKSCLGTFPFMPDFLLKKFLLANFPTHIDHVEVMQSVDFMVHQVEHLSQSQLASRLILSCKKGPLLAENLDTDDLPITVIDVKYITDRD
eukprot:TRINITY_DN2197_c0_g1_i2.p1 TRINITY_DN2197_c0_g1~~TRINITY_DN2197_c0_g1_i2.p1  ORF type:complete len:126 (-),score=13.70 TRINITY_DN2197_c0_g1_i2:9-386(-)